MKTRVTLQLTLSLLMMSTAIISQESDTTRCILLAHPRSEDKVNQSVLPGIEKIDLSVYDMILLGGDLTYYTSISRKSMNYLDSLFDFDSPNTLWTFGNHDLNSRSLINEYTKKPSWYVYTRDSITFLVLDTEINANGFVSSHILGDQLQMVSDVCDTLQSSAFLVLLHHRLLWMVGNDDYASRINSVGESTKQLDTSNFMQVVYPLLQKVKKKGIQVICLGGDKTKINITDSPEDSIFFFASIMAPEFSDSVNNALELSFIRPQQKMEYRYVSLSELNSEKPVNYVPLHTQDLLKIHRGSRDDEVLIQLKDAGSDPVRVMVFSVNGILYRSALIRAGEEISFIPGTTGVYLIRAYSKQFVASYKVILF